MTGVTRIAKLDFFIMKSQGISYLSLVAVILMFGLMGSSITVLCITGAWFIALMATNIFAIQEKNHLDRLYGSVCVSLNEVVLGRYTFVFLNYLATMFAIIILRFRCVRGRMVRPLWLFLQGESHRRGLRRERRLD